jgi:hypothetical protein
MSKFCTQCGTPAANEAVKFCSKCGASLPAAASAPAPPSPAPQHQPVAHATPPATPPAAQAPAPAAAGAAAGAAAAKGSGTLVKVIVGVLAFFVLIGALGVATCVYFGYKAKQKIEQAKTEYGLGDNGPAATARDVCSLISKEEVSQLTGAAVTDAQGTTNRCTYSSASDPVVLETDVGWSGGKLGLKLGVAALRRMGGVDTVKQLQGIGDEAYTIALPAQTESDMKQEAQKDQTGTVKGMVHLMSESPVIFRKADVMVTVRLMEATDPDAAKQAIAKTIASRL